MKYIFFGTPRFAAIILEKLIEAGFPPAVVVCNPDKPAGRKLVMTPPATKSLIARLQDCKIKIWQPQKLEIGNWKLEIGEIKPDFAIIAAYGKIIPKEILEISKFGTIGVHPSLLPKYRGPTPIQTAILNGEKETGITLFMVDEKVDHGTILAQQELENYELRIMNYESLNDRLAKLGAELLIDFLTKNNTKEVGLPNIEFEPQNESQATYTKKFTTQDGYVESIDLENAQKNGGEIAIQIERKIRALNPEPGVWTYSYESTNMYENTKTKKRVKLLEAEIIDKKLRLKSIQVEGKLPTEIK